MKTRTYLTVAAIAFLTSLSVAAANSSRSKEITAKSSSSVSMPKDKLSLTSTQEKTAWQDIAKQARKEKAPAGFSTKVGAVVPQALMTYPVPITTSSKVPALRRYQYALLENNKLLIVNPRDNKVADIITH
jgi:hypothetical protein